MNILKTGVVKPELPKTYFGECRECGCQMEAGPHEVKWNESAQTLYVECPTDGCGCWVPVEEKVYR